MATDRLRVMSCCPNVIQSFETAIWSDKSITEDIRLDDGSINIDVLDAQEYATERHLHELVETSILMR